MQCFVTRLQALYDLREATAWVSGTDMHEMFYQLVGEAAPSGKDSITVSKIKESYPETYNLLTEEKYCVVLRKAGYWDVWKTPKGNVKKFNMIAASMFAHSMRGQAVTLAQGEYLQNKEIELVRVYDGLVIDDTNPERKVLDYVDLGDC